MINQLSEEYNAHFRTISASAPPLEWDSPLAPGQDLTLRTFIYSLLDQHVHHNLCANNISWILSLVHVLLPGDANIVPRTRQDYDRIIAGLVDNTRFFLTCAMHCAPCGRTAKKCSVCNEPLFIDGKPAGLFYVRDPRVWAKRFTKLLSLWGAMRELIMCASLHRMDSASIEKIVNPQNN